MSESDAQALPGEVGGGGAPIAAPVVIDGYVPPEGTQYAQPRTPFARTEWDGSQNGYKRIDENDTRPLGCRRRRRNGKPPSHAELRE